MALLEQWRSMAYSETANKGDLKRLWQKYFLKEKEIYAQLLEDPDTEVKGTVKELAEKYNVDIMTMTGFLDGINDSLVEANPIEEMEEDTPVSLKFDKALLYKTWLVQKLTGYTVCHSGKRSSMRKQEKHFTKSRRALQRS